MNPSQHATISSAVRPHVAVVLGGGLTGMLAAAALSEYAEVFVVERDYLPLTPSSRRGLPQAHHAHLLWSGGARAVEDLLPGSIERWLADGARRVPLPTGLVSLSAQGWIRRWPEMQYLISCSRDLLDWSVRERVLARPGITLLEGTEPVALSGTAEHITGVRVRDLADGTVRRLDADLVVDATGRDSDAPRWLSDLGLPRVAEETVDSGLVHASRIFRAPPGSEHFPVVSVQSDARRQVPGQTATLVPIEHGLWLVTLSGTRAGQPSGDAARFESFARRVRHPVVGELIARAEPLTDVQLTRSTANRRRRYERLGSWPTGFVVLGDAVATYNPVHGQGMTVAAHGAVALRDAVVKYGLDDPNLAQGVQRAVGRAVEGPWALATVQDVRYPGAAGPRPPATARLMRGYMERLTHAATGRPSVTRALLDVMTLSAPRTRLLNPMVALGVLLGPGRPPLPTPPLTHTERTSRPVPGPVLPPHPVDHLW